VTHVSPGLCGTCAHCHRVETKRGSVFYRCDAPGLPKYPPLPVLRCASHEPAPPRAATTQAQEP
jgi:hypothetical protein